MPAPLEWVKLYTKVITTPAWRSRPMFDRGVFYSLVAAAGLNGGDGTVHGKDTEIADLLGVSWQAARGALHRLSDGADAPLRLSNEGAVISNWPKYQPISPVEKRRVDKKRAEERETPESDREWWDGLAKEYPLIDLATERAKATDWLADHPGRQDGKLFFRNWVARAKPSVVETHPDDLKRQFPDGGWIG